MKLEAIQALMKQFEDSEMRELKIDDGDFHLYLSKNKLNNLAQTPTTKNVANNKTDQAEAKETIKVENTNESKASNDGTAVKSPLVGVVYLQAKPGQPAFVKVGDHINEGDTICIIEAMKMMTEVKSTVTGTVSAIEVENEDLVEVDQPLIMVKED